MHPDSIRRRCHGCHATPIPATWDGPTGSARAGSPHEQRHPHHRDRPGRAPHLHLPLGRAPRGDHVQPVPRARQASPCCSTPAPDGSSPPCVEAVRAIVRSRPGSGGSARGTPPDPTSTGRSAEWERVAPTASVAHGRVGCFLCLSDMADRHRVLWPTARSSTSAGHRLRWVDTPHVPGPWEAGVLFDETTRTLFCGDLFSRTGPAEPVTTDGHRQAAIAHDQLMHGHAYTPQHRADPAPPRRAQPRSGSPSCTARRSRATALPSSTPWPTTSTPCSPPEASTFTRSACSEGIPAAAGRGLPHYAPQERVGPAIAAISSCGGRGGT